MAHAHHGTKRRCPHCGAPFYDLNRAAPFTCPKCETAFSPEEQAKVPLRAARSPARQARARPAPEVEAEPETEDARAFDEDEVLEPVDDEDEPVIDAEHDDEGEEARG